MKKLKQDAQADGPVDLNRVGAIYAALEWLFQADDTPVGPLNLAVDQGYKAGWHLSDADFQPASVINDHAGTRLEWKATVSSYILESVQDRAQSLALLRRIGQQGEGLGELHDSHFWEFLELLDMLEAGQMKTLSLPRTPFAKYPPAPDTDAKTEITRAYTRLWSELLDVRYNMMLLDIFQALTAKQSDPKRRRHVKMAFDNMRPVIKRLASQLVALPLTKADDGQVAGPSFGLMFQDYPPQSDVDAVQRDLVRHEAQVLADIAGADEFQTDAAGRDIVEQLTRPGGYHEQRKNFFGE